MTVSVSGMSSPQVNTQRNQVSSQLVWRTRMLVVCVLLVLAAAAALVFQVYLSRTRLDWSIEHGLSILAEESPSNYPSMLDTWQDQTYRYWKGQRAALTTRLFRDQDLSDPRVQALLERASGANYGDRQEDWQRWYDTLRDLDAGEQPTVHRRQRIEIEQSWSAAIGRTAWFSTILPLDCSIYVASLGATLSEVDDFWDGVVRVDGVTGKAELIFQPPDRIPRDVIGLASSGRGLFVATRNGFVYSIDFEGQMLLRGYVVSSIVSAPLAIDINGDGVRDCVVVTEAGKVVAVSGQNGSTPWVIDLPGGRPSTADPPPLVQATLSAGDLYANRGLEILVMTESGEVTVLSARNGRVLDRHGVTGGLYGGAVTFTAAGRNQAAAVFGDGGGQVWALIRQSDRLEPRALCSLAIRPRDAIGGDIRTLEPIDRSATWLIATQTGQLGAWPGSVTMLDGSFSMRWRYPVSGEVWSAPAVADINADGVSELIVGSIDRDDGGQEIGRVTVLSPDGHCLRRLTLKSGIEATPIVADVNGTGRLEILVADRAGWLHCYAIPGYGRVEWGLAGGDSRNTRNAEDAFKWGQLTPGRQKEF
jgi:hypothetical protein